VARRWTRAPTAHEVNSAIPPKLEQIVNRAIEKDREHGYQTAAEIRADLQSLTADQAKESGKSGVRSRWKWLVAAAVACLAIIAPGNCVVEDGVPGFVVNVGEDDCVFIRSLDRFVRMPVQPGSFGEPFNTT
jgi:hypothetical protein